MSQDTDKHTPASPEVQPSEVRDELEQDNISHEGEPMRPSKNQTDAQSHMGAMEDNVTSVMPPVSGPPNLTESGDDEENPDITPQNELTPG